MAQQYYIRPNNRKVNITRQKTEYHCAAIELAVKQIELAVKQIELKKALAFASAFFMVPLTGIEPVRCFHRGILSPLRLPVPPQRR